MSGRTKRKPNKPIAVENILGWMLQANSIVSTHKSQGTTLFITSKEGEEIHDQLKRFWELEEVEKENELKWTSEEMKVHENFEATIIHEKSGQYQLCLAVKEEIKKNA